MSIHELIGAAYSKGVDMRVQGDVLRLEGPRGALTTELCQMLRAHKAELLRVVKSVGGSIDSERPPLISRPAERQEELPLSYAQQGLWFLHQFAPMSAVSNSAIAVHVNGKLDVDLLTECLNHLIDRHEVLRVAFPETAGGPVQRVLPAVVISTPLLDLRHLPASTRRAEALRLAHQAAAEPFDLTQPPLLRVKVMRLDDADFLLVMTIHHIVSDGWSIGILLRELSACYAMLENKQAPSLPALSLQYGDFAYWQRRWFQGDRLRQKIQQWRERLADAPALLHLPMAKSRPPVMTFNGRQRFYEVPSALTAGLLEVARRQQTTAFVALFASFALVLARYASTEDLVIATTAANRPSAALGEVVGPFVNSVPIRVDASGNPSFADLLQRVQERSLEAFAFGDLPFEMLVQELLPNWHMQYPPIAQVGLVFQNMPLPDLKLGRFPITLIDLERQVARADLIVFLRQDAGGLRAFIEYNADLFDDLAIDELWRDLMSALSQVATDPMLRLSEVGLPNHDYRCVGSVYEGVL